MQQVVTTQPLENVRDEFQNHLAQFLETELQLGHTFTALASTEQTLGNAERFGHAKGDASKAVAAIRKFLDRVEDTQARSELAERCTELERAIDALSPGVNGKTPS